MYPLSGHPRRGGLFLHQNRPGEMYHYTTLPPMDPPQQMGAIRMRFQIDDKNINPQVIHKTNKTFNRETPRSNERVHAGKFQCVSHTLVYLWHPPHYQNPGCFYITISEGIQLSSENYGCHFHLILPVIPEQHM